MAAFDSDAFDGTDAYDSDAFDFDSTGGDEYGTFLSYFASFYNWFWLRS